MKQDWGDCMVNKLSAKAREAFVQYSKKMCTRVTIFWMIYRLANFLVVLFLPQVLSALVELTAGVDTIMIVNMSVYTLNSGTEKVAVAFSNRKSLFSSSGDDDDESEEENDDDDSSNG